MEDGAIELITEWPVTSSIHSPSPPSPSLEHGHPSPPPSTPCHRLDPAVSGVDERETCVSPACRCRCSKIDYSIPHRKDCVVSGNSLKRKSLDCDPSSETERGFSYSRIKVPRKTDLKTNHVHDIYESNNESNQTEQTSLSVNIRNTSDTEVCSTTQVCVTETENKSTNPTDRETVKHLTCTHTDRESVKHLTSKHIDSGGCGELLVQPRLARWWRRQGQHLVTATHLRNKTTLPATSNPNTLLFHVARLPEGQAFLAAEHGRLKKRVERGDDSGGVLAALGSIEDWQGRQEEAEHHLTLAIAEQPDNKEWRWLLHKVQRQLHMKRRQTQLMARLPPHPSFPPSRQVDRVSCTELSFADFFHRYAVRRRPVIITDMVAHMTATPWDLQHVRHVAGECRAKVKRSVPGSVEWAGLEDSRLLTVAQFLDDMETGCHDYLFDWSLPLHCPRLAEELTIPRYFAGDFLQRTMPGSLYRDSWPSLFIAPPSVHSRLHVDAFASNFWMALFQGSKRWLFFNEEDTACLYPQYPHSLDPTFQVDVTDPDLTVHPLLSLVHPLECVLQTGEVLFVPGGSAHCVQNVDTTLAISANFVDLSNQGRVLQELKVNALLDPRAADLASQFQQPSFPTAMKPDMTDLPWADFKTWPPCDLERYTLMDCDSKETTSHTGH